MAELYEISTLSGPLLAMDTISAGAHDWVSDSDATGELLGAWHTEIGVLGCLLVLRGFEDAQALAAERRRALLSANPFNGGRVVSALEMASYAAFPFLPPVQPRAFGGVYEVRTYFLKPGGLPATLAGWEAAMQPAREYTEHLVINLYALDGPPRITHIWGFASLEERAALRARHYAARVWPPKGGPENIQHAASTIALPEPYSPLC